MRGFPKSMIETTKQGGFWDRCKELLHVVPADRLGDRVIGSLLQREVDDKLAAGLSRITGADSTEAAPLAVGKQSPTSELAFTKFSTPGPLLDLYEKQRRLAKHGEGSPLMIATDCIVERFRIDPDDPAHHVNVLETSRGGLCFPKGHTNIILATGAIPSTTILFNSLGKDALPNAGKRVTGHFLTHVAARFPMNSERFPCGQGPNPDKIDKDRLQIAASYLAGKDPDTGLQYHIQITALHSPHPKDDAVDAGRGRAFAALYPSDRPLP